MNISRKRIGLCGALLALGAFGAGLGLRPLLGHNCAHTAPVEGAWRAHPGPWGVLDYTPFSIVAPEELLPVRTLESQPLRWHFDGMAPEEVARALVAAGVTVAECGQLLPPAGTRAAKTGTVVAPVRAAVQALDPAVRREVYKLLARFPANLDDFVFVPTATLETRLKSCGVARETGALAGQWNCAYGRYTVFFGLPCLLAAIPDYAEKVRFMKALSQQNTYLLRLHVTPETDLDALHGYWGRACWSLDVKTFLSSLATVRGGTWLDVVELLPPLPSSLLYTFPLPQNQLNGPVLRRDCHWTAFNFFREPPEDLYANPEYVLQKLKSDFFPVPADPRFGDIVLFTRPDGSTIHSAVYLADDFVFTKNGDTEFHPWIISTVPDLVAQYSFMVAPDQRLAVLYFRNKYY